MDFGTLFDENIRVKLSRPTAVPRARLRLACAAIPLALALLGTACNDTRDRVQNALKADKGDPVWQGDSTLLATHPEVLFRVTRDSTGARVVPIATVGANGFRLLTLGNRGWRSFDLEYLFAGKTLIPLHDGRALPQVASTRGMWEGAALDTINGCSILVPGGLVPIPDSIQFLSSGTRSPLKPGKSLSADELQKAIDGIEALIAPSVGISLSMLPRYQRLIRVVETGNGPMPSIVVVLNDPEVAPDTVPKMGARPRQLVVVLDQGVYGYKPTFTYSTLGNQSTPPRYTYLDHLDIDDDGKSELFFGLELKGAPLYTIVLRFESEAWREVLRNPRGRCHG